MKSFFKLKIKALRLTKAAFTLAELLITLVIIGVVAAITVPILFNNTNDKEYNVARQKAKATIGEAFKQMSVNGEIDTSLTTNYFAENIIPKYLKIAQLCGVGNAENAQKCGFSSTIKQANGTNISITDMPFTWQDLTYAKSYKSDAPAIDEWGELLVFSSEGHNNSYVFRTIDGFSVNFFYNPNCVSNENEKIVIYNVDYGAPKAQMAIDVACFNAVYDMNGEKGPNQVGKDIGFVGEFYNGYLAQTSVVLPNGEQKQISTLPDGSDRTGKAIEYCNNLDDGETWIMPDINELSLIFLNNKLIRGSETGKWFWSRNQVTGRFSNYGVNFSVDYAGARNWRARTYTATDRYVRCVRK